MFYKVIFAIVIVTSLLAAAAWWVFDEQNFGVRSQLPSTLSGCKGDGGWLEGLSGTGVELAMDLTQCGTKTYLSLQRVTHYDTAKNPHWALLDFVVLPDLQKDESIGEHFDCTYKVDGKEGVVTIGKWHHTPLKSYASDISYAIRANHKTMKLERLNPKQVKCEYFENRE